MARRLGWSDAILGGLADFERLDLDEPTRWALRLAEQVARGDGHLEAAFFADLRRHFDESQLVELLAVAGLFSYFNRFNNALEMQPTQPGER